MESFQSFTLDVILYLPTFEYTVFYLKIFDLHIGKRHFLHTKHVQLCRPSNDKMEL